MVPWYIAWPLRKAAMIPIVVMSGIAVGSTYGSWDLASRVTAVVLPKGPKKQRKYTGIVTQSSSLSVMIVVAALRETMFRPSIVPPPDLPLDGVPLQQRVQNAARVMAHQMIHGLPLVKHRVMTGFLAGTLGGVVFSLSSWLYNKKRVAKESVRSSAYSSVNGSGETISRDEDSEEGEEEEGEPVPQAQGKQAFVGVQGTVDNTQFQDDETAVHTEEDMAGMGYEQGEGPKQGSQGSQGKGPAKGSVQAALQKRYEAQHGHHADDPLAALGLYGYSPIQPGSATGRPDDMLDTLVQAASASAAAAAAQAKGEPNSASNHDDEFLESYSDAYSATGARDAARPLGGGGSAPGQQGEEEDGAHAGGVWDPYDPASRKGQESRE